MISTTTTISMMMAAMMMMMMMMVGSGLGLRMDGGDDGRMETRGSSRTSPLLFKFFSDIVDANGDLLLDNNDVALFLSATYERTVPRDQVGAIVAQMDLDGDGVVTWDEFRTTYAGLLAEEEGEAGKGTSRATTTPRGVHLSCTEGKEAGDDQGSTAWVVWETEEATVAGDVVEWGTSPGLYTSSAAASQFTYESGQFGFYYDGWLHEARFTALSPQTTYYYRVGSAGGGWSPEFSFVSRPSHNSSEWRLPLRFLIYGDMGTFMPFGRNVSAAIAARHSQQRYDLTIHLGDIAYAGVGYTYEWNIVWEIFMRQIEPFASSLFYMTVAGNHESYYSFAAYRARFRMPQGGHPSPPADRMHGFYYSFDYGPIHFCVIVTDTFPPDNTDPFDPDGPVITWLHEDLSRAVANRNNVPFIVVASHKPIYTTTDWTNCCLGMPSFEPPLLPYNVDLFLAGHVHSYERTYPVFNGTTTGPSDGERYENVPFPIHVTVGTAGAWVGADRWVEPPPSYLAYREFSYGFAHIDVDEDNVLRFQYFSNAGNRLEETILRDEFYIARNANSPKQTK